MMYLIPPGKHDYFKEELETLFKQRHKVFNKQCHWELPSTEGKEYDKFDNKHTAYLIYKNKSGELSGGLRMIPATRSHMLKEVFSFLIEKPYKVSDEIWECSRFFVDNSQCENTTPLIKEATYELLIGMLTFALQWNVKRIITPSEVRMERVLRMVNWPLNRLGNHKRINNTFAVAGYLNVSKEIKINLHKKIKTKNVILWSPIS